MSTTDTDLRADPFWPRYSPAVGGQPQSIVVSWTDRQKGRQERQVGDTAQADLLVSAIRANPDATAGFIIRHYCPRIQFAVVCFNEIRGRREHQCQSADDAARLAEDLRSDPYTREVTVTAQPVRTSERFVIHDATGRPV